MQVSFVELKSPRGCSSSTIMEESLNKTHDGNMYQQDALQLMNENPDKTFGPDNRSMEELPNMADGGDMYQQDVQLGGNPGDIYALNDRSSMVRLDNMSDGGTYEQVPASSDESYRCDLGNRVMMADMQNTANGGSMDAQNGLQQDDTRGQDRCGLSGQNLVQDVERTLAEVVEETYLDDDEMDARMAAAEKELAAAEESRIRQHEELVLLRQQLAAVITQTKREDEKNKKMGARLDEIEAEFQQLDVQCDKVTTAHSNYFEKRAKLCKFSQFVVELEELVRQELESFKEQGRRELADLELLLQEEQAKTNALLDEKDDFEDLQEESEDIDKEIRDLEIKLHLEVKRDERDSERILLLTEQIAEEEERLKRTYEMEEEVKRLQRTNEENRALLNAELARKDEMERRANLQKSRLEAITARYNSLKQVNSEMKKKSEECNSKGAIVRKDLEQCVKDLVILPHKNSLEIDGMRKMRSDFEERIRREERKLEESHKDNDDHKERIFAMEREISRLNQDTLQKEVKLDSLKTRLIQQEDQHQCSIEALEMIGRKIEERKNEDAYAGFCYEGELAKEAVHIEHMRSCIKEIDEVIALRELEKNILEEEWEALINETEAIRDALTSRAVTLHPVESDDVWLEEMRKKYETQVRDLKEECSKARQNSHDLRSEIEELRAAVKAQEASAESASQKKESVESTIPPLKAALLATVKMIDELKQKIEERNGSISLLKEMEAKLEKEIESLSTGDVSHRKSVLKKEIEEVDKQIEERRRNVDVLQAENSALEKKIAEEQVRGEEVIRAKREKIADLDKLAAEKEAENRQYIDKLAKMNAMIKGNKDKHAYRLKRTEEINQNVAVLEKEVSDLEETLGQLKADTSEKEKKRTAEIEALQKEIATIKKTADNKEKAFTKRRSSLMEQIKAAQTKLKTLISEKAKAEEMKDNTNMRAPSQDEWSTVKYSGNSYSDTNTFGVLTQRTPTAKQQGNRSPSSDSVSSMELSNGDMAAVRSGRVNIWNLMELHSQESKAKKKSASQK